MNELNKLYKSMLMSWGAAIKPDGRIVYSIGGQEFPIRIDEMDMYLPLSEVLDSNCTNKVFFHPACENITSKETEVFKIVRKMTCMKLLEVFRAIPTVLFGIGAAKEKKAWRQDILDMMEPIKNAKRATRDELNSFLLIMHVEVDESGIDNRFVHFKVTKSGGRNKNTGERIYYKTKPSFPFYNEIVKRLARSEGQSDNQMVDFNNNSVSRAVLKLAMHLFQSIVPAVLAPDDYEFDSTQPVAARLVSYLGCYSEVAEQMNRIQSTFRAEFDKAGVYPIDLNWVEYMETLPDIYRQVPVMDYNSHNTQEESTAQVQHRTDMGNLLTVSTGGQSNTIQQQPQPSVYQQPTGIQHTTTGDYDMTVPMMQPGDRFVRSEIDHMQGRVLHHAINTATNVPVVYHCTRHGNLLQRVEPVANMGGFGMMNPMANMGMMQMPGFGGMGMMGATPMGNGMVMLPNGMIVQQGAPVTAGGAVNNQASTGSFDFMTPATF